MFLQPYFGVSVKAGTPPGTPGTLPGTPGTLPGTPPGAPPGTPGTPPGTRWNTSYAATHVFLYI
jgi:hypothetical protein